MKKKKESSEKKSKEHDQKEQQFNQARKMAGEERLITTEEPKWIQALKNPSTSYKRLLAEKTRNLQKKSGSGN